MTYFPVQIINGEPLCRKSQERPEICKSSCVSLPTTPRKEPWAQPSVLRDPHSRATQERAQRTLSDVTAPKQQKDPGAFAFYSWSSSFISPEITLKILVLSNPTLEVSKGTLARALLEGWAQTHLKHFPWKCSSDWSRFPEPESVHRASPSRGDNLHTQTGTFHPLYVILTEHQAGV